MVCSLSRAIEEWVEEWVVAGRHDRAHFGIHISKRVIVMLTAFDKLSHVPFQIGCGGCRGFDVHEAVWPES